MSRLESAMGENLDLGKLTEPAQLLLAEVRDIEHAFPLYILAEDDNKFRAEPVLPISVHRHTIEGLVVTEPRVQASVIIQIASEYLGVDPAKILGHSRKQDILESRHIVMYLIRNLTKLSYPSIGKILDKDHTTIIGAIKRMDERLKDPKRAHLKAKIDAITQILRDPSLNPDDATVVVTGHTPKPIVLCSEGLFLCDLVDIPSDITDLLGEPPLSKGLDWQNRFTSRELWEQYLLTAERRVKVIRASGCLAAGSLES